MDLQQNHHLPPHLHILEKTPTMHVLARAFFSAFLSMADLLINVDLSSLERTALSDSSPLFISATVMFCREKTLSQNSWWKFGE